ncbi:MAG: DUF2520 domain-containing protein [Micrococcales bacterium]|nr:DUF2520 domain-containing protein [Micrococcales bacterium]
MESQRPARLDVGVVSAGRLGSVVGAALHAAGHRVVATSGLSDASVARARTLLPGVPIYPADEVVSRAELIILAVPDPVLPDLVTGLSRRGAWQAGQIVVHTSARHGIDVLASAAASHILPIALHPAMRFTGSPSDLERLPDACVAVTTTPALRPVGEALVIEMGAEPVWVDAAGRARYAAAVAHAVDHLPVVVDQAAELLLAARVVGGRRLLATLMLTALEGALRGQTRGDGVAALADLDSLRADLETLHESAPDSRAVHLALARAAASRAIAAGVLPSADVDGLLDLLAMPPAAD